MKAIEIDPTFVPAPITLAELRRSQGQESAAEETLKAALQRMPDAAPLLHAFGLSLVRQKRTDEAVDALSQAAKLAPETPSFAYVAGVALHDTGKPAEGVQLLQDALSRHPYDRDILYALATYDLEVRQQDSALSHANLLHELEPESQQIDQLLATIHRSMR